jgi:hypothetical protein
MVTSLSALRTGRALLARNIIFLILVLISVTGCEPQGLVRLEGLGELKIFIHPIGSQTRDLPACNHYLCFLSREEAA